MFLLQVWLETLQRNAEGKATRADPSALGVAAGGR